MYIWVWSYMDNIDNLLETSIWVSFNSSRLGLMRCLTLTAVHSGPCHRQLGISGLWGLALGYEQGVEDQGVLFMRVQSRTVGMLMISWTIELHQMFVHLVQKICHLCVLYWLICGENRFNLHIYLIHLNSNFAI